MSVLVCEGVFSLHIPGHNVLPVQDLLNKIKANTRKSSALFTYPLIFDEFFLSSLDIWGHWDSKAIWTSSWFGADRPVDLVRTSYVSGDFYSITPWELLSSLVVLTVTTELHRLLSCLLNAKDVSVSRETEDLEQTRLRSRLRRLKLTAWNYWALASLQVLILHVLILIRRTPRLSLARLSLWCMYWRLVFHPALAARLSW